MGKEFDFGSLKPKKEAKKDLPHPPIAPKPTPKTLHPPKPVKTEDAIIPKDLEAKILDFMEKRFAELLEQNIKPLNIDYDKISNRSDMIRERYLLVTGKTWRGNDANCKKALSKLHVVENPNLANLVKELKENFLNGFTKPSQIK